MMGQKTPSSTSGLKPNSGEWLTRQRAGLPFKGPQGPGEAGRQEPHEVQRRQVQSLPPVEMTPHNTTG